MLHMLGCPRSCPETRTKNYIKNQISQLIEFDDRVHSGTTVRKSTIVLKMTIVMFVRKKHRQP